MQIISKHKNNQGSTTLTILLILMLVIISVLVYFLVAKKPPKVEKGLGIESPTSAQQLKSTSSTFTDGLKNPLFSEHYELDEFGEGISSKEIFEIDLDGDGFKDRITKTKNENGTAHFFYDYKIELNKNGSYINITPDGFRTTEGTECSLQKLQFQFKPTFQVIKISRKWEDTWNTPTTAYKTTYKFANGKLIPSNEEKMQEICDVAELF